MNVFGFLLYLLPKWLRQVVKITLFASLGVMLLAVAPALAQENAAQASGPFAFIGQIQDQIANALQWIDGLGPIKYIVFLIGYVLITIAFLPASVVTLGAGAIFGVVTGSILVFIGAMIGATLAFLIGRFVARDWIAKKVAGNRFFQSLDNSIAEEGRKLIFLIRLSPAFPFNLLNYALGLTKVSLPDYVLGTTGIIPGTIMYVYLGSLIGDVAMIGQETAETSPQEVVIGWIIRILIFVTIAAISLYIAKIAKKALNESVPEAQKASADIA